MTELRHCKENFNLLLHFNIKLFLTYSYILYDLKNKKKICQEPVQIGTEKIQCSTTFEKA